MQEGSLHLLGATRLAADRRSDRAPARATKQNRIPELITTTFYELRKCKNVKITQCFTSNSFSPKRRLPKPYKLMDEIAIKHNGILTKISFTNTAQRRNFKTCKFIRNYVSFDLRSPLLSTRNEVRKSRKIVVFPRAGRTFSLLHLRCA